MLVARLQHPVVVEVGEQRPAVQRDRGLEPPGGDVRVELGEVGLAAQRDAVAAGDQRVVVAERPPQLPQRAAQRGARARVEHVGPEARGDRAARVLARMQREPRQQRPRATARRAAATAAPSTSACNSPRSRTRSMGGKPIPALTLG